MLRILWLLLLVVVFAGCPTPSPNPTPTPMPTPTPDPTPLPDPTPPGPPRPPFQPPPPPTDFSATSQALLLSHNNERVKAGVTPLVLDKQLDAAAGKHAVWMAAANQLDHTGPNGSSHSDRIKAEGYRPKASGENIAMGYSSVSAVMGGWMTSSGHRRNILNPVYSQCGFGMAVDGRGRKWWCTVFASPKLSKSEADIFQGDSTPPGITSDEN